MYSANLGALCLERSLEMGKDLKGRELGEGIVQRSNGTYQARFVDKFGNRRQKKSKKLQEVR